MSAVIIEEDAGGNEFDQNGLDEILDELVEVEKHEERKKAMGDSDIDSDDDGGGGGGGGTKAAPITDRYSGMLINPSRSHHLLVSNRREIIVTPQTPSKWSVAVETVCAIALALLERSKHLEMHSVSSRLVETWVTLLTRSVGMFVRELENSREVVNDDLKKWQETYSSKLASINTPRGMLVKTVPALVRSHADLLRTVASMDADLIEVFNKHIAAIRYLAPYTDLTSSVEHSKKVMVGALQKVSENESRVILGHQPILLTLVRQLSRSMSRMKSVLDSAIKVLDLIRSKAVDAEIPVSVLKVLVDAHREISGMSTAITVIEMNVEAIKAEMEGGRGDAATSVSVSIQRSSKDIIDKMEMIQQCTLQAKSNLTTIKSVLLQNLRTETGTDDTTGVITTTSDRKEQLLETAQKIRVEITELDNTMNQKMVWLKDAQDAKINAGSRASTDFLDSVDARISKIQQALMDLAEQKQEKVDRLHELEMSLSKISITAAIRDVRDVIAKLDTIEEDMRSVNSTAENTLVEINKTVRNAEMIRSSIKQETKARISTLRQTKRDQSVQALQKILITMRRELTEVAKRVEASVRTKWMETERLMGSIVNTGVMFKQYVADTELILADHKAVMLIASETIRAIIARWMFRSIYELYHKVQSIKEMAKSAEEDDDLDMA